jgi:release factor H-coupled RctB family protein
MWNSAVPFILLCTNFESKKIAATLKGLDEPWSGPVSGWLAKYGIDKSSPFDASSLGTVGAGNHFAEICTVEKIVDNSAAELLKFNEDDRFLSGTTF